MQDIELVQAHAWSSGAKKRPYPPVLRCLSLARGGWGGRRHDQGRIGVLFLSKQGVQ